MCVVIEMDVKLVDMEIWVWVGYGWLDGGCY